MGPRFIYNTKKAPIDGQFFSNYYYGFGGYWFRSKINIYSKIPIKIEVNDPEQKLLVKKNSIVNKPAYSSEAEIKLVKPITDVVIDESQFSKRNPYYRTYLSISSLNNWQTLGKLLSDKYDIVLNQKLPRIFLNTLKSASQKKDLSKQINEITTELHKKIKHFSDLRSIEGKFIPRNLALIEADQFGDCKDFALIFTKILRSLGYEANIALVRIENSPNVEKKVPNMYDFNHAIVKVIDANKKVCWIDPSAKANIINGVLPNISDRFALVLNGSESTYEKIPLISEENAQILLDQIIDGDVTHANMSFKGETASYS